MKGESNHGVHNQQRCKGPDKEIPWVAHIYSTGSTLANSSRHHKWHTATDQYVMWSTSSESRIEPDRATREKTQGPTGGVDIKGLPVVTYPETP